MYPERETFSPLHTTRQINGLSFRFVTKSPESEVVKRTSHWFNCWSCDVQLLGGRVVAPLGWGRGATCGSGMVIASPMKHELAYSGVSSDSSFLSLRNFSYYVTDKTHCVLCVYVASSTITSAKEVMFLALCVFLLVTRIMDRWLDGSSTSLV